MQIARNRLALVVALAGLSWSCMGPAGPHPTLGNSDAVARLVADTLIRLVLPSDRQRVAMLTADRLREHNNEGAAIFSDDLAASLAKLTGKLELIPAGRDDESRSGQRIRRFPVSWEVLAAQFWADSARVMVRTTHFGEVANKCAWDYMEALYAARHMNDQWKLETITPTTFGDGPCQ